MKRTSLGLTQEELANKLEVAKSTVALWESGEGNPRSKTVRAVENFFREFAAAESGNPFQVDITDPETANTIADAILDIDATLAKVIAIRAILRDLENSLLATESRLRSAIGAEKTPPHPPWA